ncbi:NAD(+) synthase [uncultured Anaerococcus sp.]|uniref:NAD(+) synthase n=1 Tax=uncultured Anaerococcus sp. TaxID=293428 RepID=UPI00288A0903|nr:NAD(+) synthase [uncultured Anaerococcus sp.]
MKRNIKIKSASFPVSLGNVAENVKQIKNLINEAEEEKVNILSLPELCLTGASLYDGYLEEDLLKAAEEGLKDLLNFSKDKDLVFTVGLPIKKNGKLFNTVILIKSGDALGLVVKNNLKTYEKTIFSNDYDLAITIGEHFLDNNGNYPIYVGGLYIGISIGEDEKENIPKSLNLKEQNADIILNPSAFPRHIGTFNKLSEDISYLSKNVIYVHTPACSGESSTDIVYEDKSIIAENGEVLDGCTGIFYLEVEDEFHYTNFNNFTKETYSIEKFPYLPKEDYSKDYLEDALEIQALGLIQRMKAIGTEKTYLGVSGGIDSTAALLAINKAYEIAGFDKAKIGAYTMPAFGTSDRTKSNAYKLCQALGIDLKEINISKSVTAHLKDIGHDGLTPDLAYENAQARMRTQVLFNLSNMGGGFVVGTGDLSENMQGFATYNGDHMSSYSLNASLMKTELRYLIKSYAHFTENEDLKNVLTDILDTPVSPELVSEKEGEITQKTEDIIGPYELIDFFIYQHLTYHKSAREILKDAEIAFKDTYDKDTIKKWLMSYFDRFTKSQFKRSASVDGPNVTGRSFSPRLGFKIPSDMASDLYLGKLDEK